MQFQAINTVYQYLQQPKNRQSYHETGEVPEEDDDTPTNQEGVNQWKAYFERMFGRVTMNEIDDFRNKYKMSDEERNDVLKEFKKHKGDLIKMLDYVMLSEPCDAVRWVKDYLVPAMETGELSDTYKSTMEKTLKTCQKRVQDAADETETEDEEETAPQPKATESKRTKKRKTKSQNNDISNLVAQIQNKRRSGMANLGARYGVDMEEDDDPLADDDAFAQARARLKK